MVDQTLKIVAPVMRRRAFLASTAAALLAGSTLSGCGSRGSGNDVAAWGDLLTDIAAIVIPQTDTASAGAPEVGTVNAVINAIRVGLDDAKFEMLELIRDDLDERCSGNYLKSGEAKRVAAVTALDDASFGTEVGADPSPTPPPEFAAWRTVKGLILMSYYTSQIGGSQELIYELVPGRFDADIPADAATPALSSDWSGASMR